MVASTFSAAREIKRDQLAASPIFSHLIRAADLQPDRSSSPHDRACSQFGLAALRGRLAELSSDRSAGCLSLGCTLLLEAQTHSTPAVWISLTRDSFFPPDLAANGVDLSLLPMVWAPDLSAAVRASDQLMRTGAFGLLIVDLYRNARLPAPLQARLARLALRHGCAVCFLTVKPDGFPSLGSMISLFARVVRIRSTGARFRLELRVVKDKRTAPVWRCVEHIDGPPGMY